ncbi:MAG: phosphoribosyl-AMP cyclohydrolase / phosphoribosyl-ATP pyrophosphohydrolase [Eubacteriaceae bacterium]|nr:phosphoribosyl-AMP cyclohydrolase / phosphoribosyl-ATP pyrophosphohydrolase [Eubacteriaceae bacterium]MDK2961251.1 phosphoribosyl-AMP cyclohydrolase / phosphoribosyl-ATP pyrophosphohydrolase [Eubacteriaceae bacterium]MDN5306730.1 phosphoribosyl-AMP cyclohydrolase / phosphoribosyl-ATP pyrophosphohydrolase [Eubacteriaceae bacterium]
MDFTDIKFNEAGLIPAIVQDYHTRQVLMMAWMNEETLKQSIESGLATFYSRSRQEVWVKGATSGNTQHIVGIEYDCDGDTLLLQVNPDGPACHTGSISCFYRTLSTNKDLKKGNPDILNKLVKLLEDRRENPKEGSYTNYLFEKGVDKICKKIGEEAAETIIAAKNNDPTELTYEASDLIYHLLVLLNNQDVALDSIYEELTKRHK